MRLRCALRIVLAATFLLDAARAANAQEPVKVRSGLIKGTRDGDVAIYKGIPFAAPPVGDLRWKPPQAAPRWDGVREATTFGSLCLQPPFGPTAALAKESSEDCLTLNVWTPEPTPASPAAVLVVIPGGGFFGGGSADARTDGRALAGQGVVVVSFNYRLGVFGFFAHPMLSKESPTGVSGNYGLMDQIAALRWIQDNIAAFGGDPRNVTISGNSAGGSSVLYLMVSPMARGLFSRAIAQSAAQVYGPLGALRERRYGREPREAEGAKLGANIAELRALSAKDLLAQSNTRTDVMFADGPDYWPMVDGAVLPDEPWTLFESGRFARVPLIIGTVADEGTLFSHIFRITTAQAWREHLARRHPGVEAAVQAEYAATADPLVHPAAVRWVNDWYFHGTARGVARAVASHGVPVYLYNFSRVPPLQPFRSVSLGAFHSAEIDYQFGAPSAPGGRADPYEETDRALARSIKRAWVQFARTADPNGNGLPTWPRYQKSTDQHIDFGAEIRVGSGLHARSLDVYDSAFATMRAAYRR